MKPSRNVDKTKKTERYILFFRNQNDWQIPRKKERKKERKREREMQVCEQRVDIKMFLSVRIFPTLSNSYSLVVLGEDSKSGGRKFESWRRCQRQVKQFIPLICPIFFIVC